jgi:hypothetical protein
VQLDDSKNYPAQKPDAPLCLVLPCFLSENTVVISIFLDKRFPPLLLKAKLKSHSFSYIPSKHCLDRRYMDNCRVAVSSCIFESSDYLRRPTKSRVIFSLLCMNLIVHVPKFLTHRLFSSAM